MRYLRWALLTLSILASRIAATELQDIHRHAEYVGYKLDPLELTAQEAVEVWEAEQAFRKCTAMVLEKLRDRPGTANPRIAARAIGFCQRLKDASIRDVAVKVHQRKMLAQRAESPPDRRGGGGYTADERAQIAEVFRAYRSCHAGADLAAKYDREDYWEGWVYLSVMDHNRRAKCQAEKDRQLGTIKAGAKKRHTAQAEKRRRKASNVGDWHVALSRAEDIGNALKGQAQSIQQASTELMHNGDIQAGLRSLMTSSVLKGVTAPVGPKMGRVPVPLRV